MQQFQMPVFFSLIKHMLKQLLIWCAHSRAQNVESILWHWKICCYAILRKLWRQLTGPCITNVVCKSRFFSVRSTKRESYLDMLERICRIQTEEQYIIPNPFANLSIKYHRFSYTQRQLNQLTSDQVTKIKYQIIN